MPTHCCVHTGLGSGKGGCVGKGGSQTRRRGAPPEKKPELNQARHAVVKERKNTEGWRELGALRNSVGRGSRLGGSRWVQPGWVDPQKRTVKRNSGTLVATWSFKLVKASYFAVSTAALLCGERVFCCAFPRARRQPHLPARRARRRRRPAGRRRRRAAGAVGVGARTPRNFFLSPGCVPFVSVGATSAFLSFRLFAAMCAKKTGAAGPTHRATAAAPSWLAWSHTWRFPAVARPSLTLSRPSPPPPYYCLLLFFPWSISRPAPR
jgi:hypothetical protein